MRPEIRELLNRYDEPGAYEFPSSFRYQEVEARAKLIAADLTRKGLRITFQDGWHNQDASFSFSILLHEFEKEEPRGLLLPTIRFSNFGNLSSVTWTNLIESEVLGTIIKSFGDHGFTYIPEEELDEVYDGVLPDKQTVSSWWIRYFDWL